MTYAMYRRVPKGTLWCTSLRRTSLMYGFDVQVHAQGCTPDVQLRCTPPRPPLIYSFMYRPRRLWWWIRRRQRHTEPRARDWPRAVRYAPSEAIVHNSPVPAPGPRSPSALRARSICKSGVSVDGGRLLTEGRP